MTIFRSVPSLAVLIVSLALAALARRGVMPRAAGLMSVCCGALLPVLITARGGTMHEALLCLCLPLWLLMPKEKSA